MSHKFLVKVKGSQDEGTATGCCNGMHGVKKPSKYLATARSDARDHYVSVMNSLRWRERVSTHFRDPRCWLLF